MYNTNSYFGGNQFGGGYVPYNNYNQYQRPTMVQQQQQAQYGDVPFLFTGYGTIDEAKAFIVPPTKAVMFIDKNKSQFYIKSCDNAGNPSLETFNYTGEGNNTTESVSPVLDPKEFVKRDELEKFSSEIGSIKADIKKLNRLADILGGKDNGK